MVHACIVNKFPRFTIVVSLIVKHASSDMVSNRNKIKFGVCASLRSNPLGTNYE